MTTHTTTTTTTLQAAVEAEMRRLSPRGRHGLAILRGQAGLSGAGLQGKAREYGRTYAAQARLAREAVNEVARDLGLQAVVAHDRATGLEVGAPLPSSGSRRGPNRLTLVGDGLVVWVA